MEDRLNQLESVAAMQDHTLAQLSEELFRQQKQVTELQQRIDAVMARLKQLEDPDQPVTDEKPPHW